MVTTRSAGTESGLQAYSQTLPEDVTMSSPVWRIVALAAIVAAILYVGFQGYVGTPGTFGNLGAGSVTSRNFLLGRITPGSSIARAGFRRGAVVHWVNWSLATRAAVAEPMPGSRATLAAANGGTATLVAQPAPRERLPALLVALRLAFLFVAGFLLLRRWQERSVRSLALFLSGFGLGLGLSGSNPVVSSAFSYAVFTYGNIALLIAAVAAAADFSAHVTGTPSRAERLFSRVTTGVAALAILALGYVELLLPTVINAVLRGPLALLGSAPFVLAIVTVVAGYVNARGADRIRKRWILWVIGLGLVGPAIDILVGAFFGYNAIVDQSALVTIAVIPIGLSYVILRHRLIDVGFVLNQAAVFAGVSVVVVGVVVLVEYLLSRYVESVSHVTSTAVQLAVALVLGFSVNAIHKRVDRIVDQLFFRKRHEAEAAMRAFSLDAAYFTDGTVLLERTTETVERHVQALGAGIWLRDAASGAYRSVAGDLIAGAVDPDDPALVAMRARHVVVDLHGSGSALPGTIAFPMTAGGELVGALLCGSKPDEEGYAPDERASLEAVAESVAHAWAALRTRALQREVERLRAHLHSATATEGAIEAV